MASVESVQTFWESSTTSAPLREQESFEDTCAENVAACFASSAVGDPGDVLRTSWATPLSRCAVGREVLKVHQAADSRDGRRCRAAFSKLTRWR